MGDSERLQAGRGPSVDNLSGEALDQAFSESIYWLRKVALDPLFPRKLHHFFGGHLYCTDSETRFIFEVCLTEGPFEKKSEVYRISTEGLTSFERISNVSEIDSSILGRLHLGQGSVCRIREERYAFLFGLDPMESEEKEVTEERKRAAIKVVQRCRYGK